MAWTVTENSQTVGTTEHDFVTDTTYDAGDLQTTKEFVGGTVRVAAMVVGDQFEIARYRTINGTTERLVLTTLTDIQTEYFELPAIMNGVGWAYTAKKLAGTDRVVHWSLLRAPE